jgi:predicted NUDIX family NTP pyrophosphohydrolase
VRRAWLDTVAPARSAGLLLHRDGPHGIEVLLVHMGGPLWARKDAGAWSIPKGEYQPHEDPLAAAHREFAEELGAAVPDAADTRPLGEVRQRNGKIVSAWAVRADFDASAAVSNLFEMEWPPRSGRRQSFPEVDRAEWFGLDAARPKLVAAQTAFLDRLREALL